MAPASRFEEHVLDRVEELVRDLVVDRDRAGVHDPHVHPGAARVVEERGVHGLAHPVAAPERERHVLTPPLTSACGRDSLIRATASEVRDRVFVVLRDPVATAKMLGSKMTSSGGEPSSRTRMS